MRQKPVIGNAFCRPVASIIHDGVDGYVCTSAGEIADRIKRLASDPALAQRLGKAGHQKVMKHYTWDVIGSKVYDLYQQIIGGTRAEQGVEQ